MKIIVKVDPDASPLVSSTTEYGLGLAALMAGEPSLLASRLRTKRWGSFLASMAIHATVVILIVVSGPVFGGRNDDTELEAALEEIERDPPRVIVLDLSIPLVAPPLLDETEAGGNKPGPGGDAGGLKAPKAAKAEGAEGGSKGDDASTVARFVVPNLPKPTPGARQTFLQPDSQLQVAEQPIPTLPNLVVRSPNNAAIPKFEYERFTFKAQADAPQPDASAVVSNQAAPDINAPLVQGGDVDFAMDRPAALQPLPPERFRMPVQGQQSSAPTAPEAIQAAAPVPSLIAQNPNPAPISGLIVLPGANQLAEFHAGEETDGPASGDPSLNAMVTSSGSDSAGANGSESGDTPGGGEGPGSGQGQLAGMGTGTGTTGAGSGGGGDVGGGHGLGDGRSTMAVSLGGGGNGSGRGTGSGPGLGGAGGGNGSGNGNGSGAGSGPGAAAGNGTGSGGGGLGSRLGDAARYIEVKMLHPETGKHDIVVVQASGEGAIPESSGLLIGKPVYTVYLDVGAPKPWILQYAVPSQGSAAQNQMVVQLGNPAPVVAPYPMVTYLPQVNADGRTGYVMLHGYLDVSGRLEELRLVRGAQSDLEKVLVPILKEWEFRPASRDGLPVRVEVLVAIPPYKV